MCDSGMILEGEIRRQSILGFTGLIRAIIHKNFFTIEIKTKLIPSLFMISHPSGLYHRLKVFINRLKYHRLKLSELS